MERADTIMERLGFKKEADDSVKAAFVKNLIKQAYGVEVKVPAQYELKAQQGVPQTFSEAMVETWMEPKVASVSSFDVRSTGKSADGAQQLSFELEYSAPKVG